MASTLVFRLTGGAANSEPDASLGGAMSSAALSGTALNNLFDNVTPAEASAGDTEYRAIDVYNSGDATAESVEVYMSSETTSADSQLDFGDGDVHDTTDQGDTIVDESTAPGGISFAHYTSVSKLSVANIPAGQACRIWVRRVISESAGNTANDTGTIAVDYA